MSSFKGRYGDTLDVAAQAGVPVTAGATGRQLIIAELSGTCDITIYSASRQAIGSATGIKVGYDVWIPDGFASVIITAATAQTIKLIVSEEPVRYNRISGSIEASIAPSSTVTYGKITVGVAATSVSAVAGQKKIFFRCDLANGGTVTNGTTAGTGPFYVAGEGDELTTGAALDLIADTAGQIVHYRQEA